MSDKSNITGDMKKEIINLLLDMEKTIEKTLSMKDDDVDIEYPISFSMSKINVPGDATLDPNGNLENIEEFPEITTQKKAPITFA
jgi:hypothetical protein